MRRKVNPVKNLSLGFLVCALLAGCAATPEWGWKRTDGQSARNNPVLLRQFEADKTACMGKTQEAGLVGAAGDRGLSSGTMRSMQDHAAMDLIQDCMAQKGYAVVPREQIDESLAAR
jgi:type IV pilus biogenesis protein CpaD/CtpE